MDIYGLCGILWVFLAVTLHHTYAASLTRQTRLLRSLLVNYDRGVKPAAAAGRQLTVKVAFTLARIEKLEERTQMMVSFGYVNMRWVDELLAWDPAAHGGDVFSLVLPTSYVWLPSLQVFNSVDLSGDLSEDLAGHVTVSYDGTVTWAPLMKWATFCDLDLSFFPFDSQVCEVKLISAYAASSVNFTLWTKRAAVPRNLFSDGGNAEWILDEAAVSREDFVMDDRWLRELGLDTAAPMVSLSLKLTRIPIFYLTNVILPTVMISVLSMMVYVLPPASGEKISFSITVLLSYSVMLLMVSEIMPRSGYSIPYITVYIVLSMFLTMLSLVITILVLTIHHHHPYRPVSACTKAVWFGCLARVFCVDVHLHTMRERRQRRSASAKVHPSKHTELTNGDVLPTAGDHYAVSDSESVTTSGSQLSRDTADDSDDEILIANKVEWEQLALVVDRVLFFFGMLFVVGLTVVFFIVVKVYAVSMGSIGETLSSIGKV